MSKKYRAIMWGILAMANTSKLAHAAPMPAGAFELMAARCAPAVPEKILEAVAHTESNLDPWVLHDDTTGIIVDPKSLDTAAIEAFRMLAHRDSFDIGLMQTNSANLAALGMTISTALDPCASMAGGAAVLQAAYGHGGATGADQQVALLMALSRYNTGSPFRGIMNGYARRVEEYTGNESIPLQTPMNDNQMLADPNAPPAWDVSATGAYARTHGAPWLIGFTAVTASPSVQNQPAPIVVGQPLSARSDVPLSTQIFARSQ